MAKEKTAELKDEIAQLKATIEAQAVKLSTAKIVKEESEIFMDSKGAPWRWINLSETKKFLEKNHIDFLETLMEANGGNMLNSNDIHTGLSELIAMGHNIKVGE